MSIPFRRLAAAGLVCFAASAAAEDINLST